MTDLDIYRAHGSGALIDLASYAADPPPKSRRKYYRMRKGRVVRRPHATVDAIELHQTACNFVAGHSLLKQAGYDADLAQHLRVAKAHYHVIAMDCGHFLYLTPFDWYVYHGNGLNARSIGFAVEGLFNGKYPKEPPQLTLETIRAAKEGLLYTVHAARDLFGINVRYVVAHRQASAARRGDPGPELWRRLVLEYAVPVLGLRTLPGLKVGTGRPIPSEWDPAGVGKF